MIRLSEDGTFAALTPLGGDIGSAAIRPDGDVWYDHSDAVTPPATRNTAGDTVIASPDPPHPRAAPTRVASR